MNIFKYSNSNAGKSLGIIYPRIILIFFLFIPEKRTIVLCLLGNCSTPVLHLQPHLIILQKRKHFFSTFLGLRGVNYGPFHVELQSQIFRDQIRLVEIYINIHLLMAEKPRQISHSKSSPQ